MAAVPGGAVDVGVFHRLPLAGLVPDGPLRARSRGRLLRSGAGALSVAAFGLLPIARGRGADFDRGEAMRALAELPWRPFAFGRLPNVTWEAQGQGGLRATFDDGRTRASVSLDIDGEGRVLGGSAIRPRAVGKKTVDTKWSGSFGDYRTFRRIRVPTSAEVAWLLPEGPFTYWRGRVTEFPG